jgi:hypothetical protein
VQCQKFRQRIVAGPTLGGRLQQVSYQTLNQHHLKRNRKFVDSPLEGAGFELLVPQSIQLDDVNAGRHAGGKSDIFATRTAHKS